MWGGTRARHNTGVNCTGRRLSWRLLHSAAKLYRWLLKLTISDPRSQLFTIDQHHALPEVGLVPSPVGRRARPKNLACEMSLCTNIQRTTSPYIGYKECGITDLFTCRLIRELVVVVVVVFFCYDCQSRSPGTWCSREIATSSRHE